MTPSSLPPRNPAIAPEAKDALRAFIDNLSSGGYIDRASELEYFRLAARLAVPATQANGLLEDAVSQLQIPRERTLVEQFKVIVDVSIRDRVLDTNEEANLLAWAARQGLERSAAERAMEERCSWAGAARESTGAKPPSPLAMKAIGAAVSLALIVVLAGIFVLASGPERRLKSYSTQALECLRRDAVLEPADSSVNRWMMAIENAGGLPRHLEAFRGEVRQAYIKKATLAAAEDPALARAYLEVAAIAAPGPEVTEANARLWPKH